MRSLTIVLLGLCLLLQYQLWISQGGIVEIFRLKTSIALQEIENNKMQERNAILLADVHSLKHGHSSIEERARSELGMIRKGEVFYRVVN